MTLVWSMLPDAPHLSWTASQWQTNNLKIRLNLGDPRANQAAAVRAGNQKVGPSAGILRGSHRWRLYLRRKQPQIKLQHKGADFYAASKEKM